METHQSRTTVTFVVPCYNSAAYMDRCLESLLTGAPDVEVVIVDDGSSEDDTPEKADQWAARHPGVVRVIHQANKGHGGAVNAGLAAASGVYLAVVDSDDWLDRTALDAALITLRDLAASERPVDLVITNYVYEHVASRTRKAIRFRGVLPEGRVFTWDELGHFGPGQNLTIHTTIYRTQVLRDAGLELPEHTFYVDNIYVYAPLPHVQTLYYAPVDLYRYFIGRPDQSVNQTVLLGRLDQHMLITRVMVEAVQLPDGAGNRRLAAYMISFLGMVVTISSVLAVIKGTPEALAARRDMWAHIAATDPALKARLARQPLVFGSNLPGPVGRGIARAGYTLAQRIYRFN